jgi:hypothetical protein
MVFGFQDTGFLVLTGLGHFGFTWIGLTSLLIQRCIKSHSWKNDFDQIWDSFDE